MKTLQTVSGVLPLQRLGHCQMHEHLFVAEGPATRKNPALQIDCPRSSLEELNRYRLSGGGSCLDAQPGGAGRNVRVLRQISQQSGVPIIAVTGYHLPQFYPKDHALFRASEGELTDFYLDELRNGCVENREVRPGAGMRLRSTRSSCGDLPRRSAGRRFLGSRRHRRHGRHAGIRYHRSV